ncbi:rhodanese-like domain-containing protein [Thermomicrobium sp. CFH 73360]|uniref:rhodanese-like domain-containing protein n=1 Tax=Thermomicrobium sp. CFH 73360 TaxID=2951987 RepID=UPI0020776F11|nr:rhodanese-like domain-containing protein [Thermomicrobium sp. CFH 73360]MCM8747044.1 rhodanese-like domain-containing protein [Thermomicrobium sp. CFH 73360]MCM8747335.1 rhodanese-like domain-containing protein [Thermomicrobium sp. CFH 73360]
MVLGRLLSRFRVPEVTPAEAHARQQSGALIIDVREPHEWRAGHIPGARLVPLDELPARLSELDPNRELILVCRSGNRSAYATMILQQAGFTRVANLAGGMIAWTRTGLPVTR